MESLYEICRRAYGKMIKYRGTNGNEFDKENHGKPLEGIGRCLGYGDSHGLFIYVCGEDGKECYVDPTEVQILE